MVDPKTADGRRRSGLSENGRADHGTGMDIFRSRSLTRCLGHGRNIRPRSPWAFISPLPSIKYRDTEYGHATETASRL